MYMFQIILIVVLFQFCLLVSKLAIVGNYYYNDVRQCEHRTINTEHTIQYMAVYSGTTLKGHP